MDGLDPHVFAVLATVMSYVAIERRKKMLSQFLSKADPTILSLLLLY
jgi:hypothetical protein